MTETLRVYWHAGCSGCMRTKECLTKRGIAFESINVTTNADGLEELLALGARSVPVVRRGDEWVSGESWANVVEFLGLDESVEPVLPPWELVTRLGHGLEAAQRYVRQLPDEKWGALIHEEGRIFVSAAGGDEKVKARTCSRVGYHIFIVADSFLRAVEGEQFTLEMLSRLPPADVRTFNQIAAYGESVRDNLWAWWGENSYADVERSLDTFYGPQTIHELLERTTWHAIQHTRQLMMVLESFGIEPDQRLDDALFEGLPMPTDVWR